MNNLAPGKEKESVELDENNPILLKDDRISIFRDQILKYTLAAAKEENLSQKQIETLMDMIEEVYREKQAKFFFENKMKDMNRVLINLSKCLLPTSKSEEESTHLYYYNRTKYSLKNEW